MGPGHVLQGSAVPFRYFWIVRELRKWQSLPVYSISKMVTELLLDLCVDQRGYFDRGSSELTEPHNELGADLGTFLERCRSIYHPRSKLNSTRAWCSGYNFDHRQNRCLVQRLSSHYARVYPWLPREM